MATEQTGLRKAAILLLSLPQDEAAQILKRLSPTQIEEVSREIASVGDIAVPARRDVCNEFYTIALANNWVTEGGLEYAKTLLMKSLSEDEAKRIIKQVT